MTQSLVGLVEKMTYWPGSFHIKEHGSTKPPSSSQEEKGVPIC